MLPLESPIKSCRLKNWANFFPILCTGLMEKYEFFIDFYWVFIDWQNMWFWKKRWFCLLCRTFILATFNMCLLTSQGNALWRSQFVLGWVQRNSNFGSSDHRLLVSCLKQYGRFFVWQDSDFCFNIFQERPFPCPHPHCEKSYVQKSVLDQHLRMKHAAVKPQKSHMCSVCGTGFFKLAHLKR